MHKVQTIVTDVHGVCLSVCLSVTNTPNDPGSALLCGAISGSACRVCGSFRAAFAEYLWLLVD